MIITREKGMRMWGGGSGNTSVSGASSGGGFSLTVAEGEGTGNAYTDFTYESGTLTLNKATEFVTVDFFNKLFTAYDANGNVIAPNNTTPTLDNIKFRAGAWTEQYLSALGQNSSGGGGGGGGIELSDVWQSLRTNTDDYQNQKINIAHIPDLSGTYATKTWVNQQGFVTSSGVTSVAMTVPTGLSVSGTPITSTGTLALTFASGYSIPTTAKQSNWDTAYGWGNHATAGYASASSVTTLQGYFTNGVAKTAAKLNTGTTTYSVWGQTYWSSGVPQSISGNMTSVGSITPSANGNNLGTSSARFNIYGTGGNFSSNVSITGTLGVTGATTLSSTLSVASGITLTTTKKIYFGDTSHYIELTSTGFHFSHGVYSDSFVSALGANSSGGGGGGIDIEAMWAELQGNTGTYANAKINVNHIPMATSSARGGVKIGYTTNGKNYAVQLSNEQMYVNVPWTDHYAWSDITDKPSSFTPSAHNHSQTVTEGDNRGIDTTPNDYQNAIKFRGLKSNSYISSPSNDTFSYLVGLRGWSNYSGGNAHELAFNDSGIFRRQGATTTWGNWYKLLDSGNYSSYALPLSGGTMTGDLYAPHIHITNTTGGNEIIFARGGYNYLRAETTGGTIGFISDGKTMIGNSVDVAIGNGWMAINNGVAGSSGYNLYVNGSINGTSVLYNGNHCIHSGNIGSQSVNYATSSGTADSANKLTTPRTIWGASFDGTANIASVAIEDVHEHIYFSRESWNYICVPSNSGNLAFNIGTAGIAYTKMCVVNNGNVGIGTTSPSSKLHVAGNILASGEVTASSDERKKNIISNTKFNVKDIASARSIIYEWNDDRDKDNEKKIHGGSIAQDWLGKADSFLSQDNDGWYSINYGALALCSAITIARMTINHEDRITLLEKENAKLKAKVAELEERRA